MCNLLNAVLSIKNKIVVGTLEVRFLLNAYHLCTIVKPKNPKWYHHKLGTACKWGHIGRRVLELWPSDMKGKQGYCWGGGYTVMRNLENACLPLGTAACGV